MVAIRCKGEKKEPELSLHSRVEKQIILEYFRKKKYSKNVVPKCVQITMFFFGEVQ